MYVIIYLIVHFVDYDLLLLTQAFVGWAMSSTSAVHYIDADVMH
jgi:hypothetical protein